MMMSKCPRIRHGVRAFACLIFLAVFVSPATVFAQAISIGPGASWRVGDAALDLDCAALNVAGTFAAQDGRVEGIGHLGINGQVTAAAAILEVGGNWSNHGSFLAGSSTVRMSDRCNQAQSSITGNTGFSTFSIESARGKSYRFEAGQTQSVALGLRLAGVPGQHLFIGSTLSGSRASVALSPNGAQQITWLNVSDMEAPVGSAWVAPDRPENFNSIDSGNNLRWFQSSSTIGLPTALPTLSPWSLLVLALAMIVLGRRGLRVR